MRTEAVSVITGAISSTYSLGISSIYSISFQIHENIWCERVCDFLSFVAATDIAIRHLSL